MNISLWNNHERIDDTYLDRPYILVKPKTTAAGRPWVWRAEFFSAFDSVDMDLLHRGWHIAYYAISDMYGAPEAVALMKQFHDFITSEYSLHQKADIFGFSRGGLYAANYTAEYPCDINTLYLDAPVLDIRSWPGGMADATRWEQEWQDCKRYYHLTGEASVLAFRENPLDKVDILLANKIPVVLCAGGADETVPYRENGQIFDKGYRAKGGEILTIVKPTCGHHPHSLGNPAPISDFIAAHQAP